MYIIVLVLILVFLYLFNNKIKFIKLKHAIDNKKPIKINNFLSSKIINKFSKQNIIKYLGDSEVTYLKYKNKSDLDTNVYKKILIKNFINNNEFNNENHKCQIKLKILNDTLIDKYIKNIFEDTKNKFYNNNIDYKYNTFRISHSKWNFPYHFDCIDQILIQLNGHRYISILDKNNKETVYKLKKGDIIYIPNQIYHEVNVDNSNELNVNLNLLLNKNYINCVKKFNNLYKEQSKKCKDNNCI